MKTYPNQKIITINKAKTDKQNTYATINKECLIKAVTELKHNELKIYLYLASNQNGYQLALSSADVAEKTNASKRKIQEAINSLIEKGYLVETGANSYDFIEDTVYKKDIVYEKDTVMCTKSTQVCVQKVHMDVYKKDTEIVQDNTINNTTDSTNANAPLSDCSLSESIQNKIKSVVGIDVKKNTVDAITAITGSEVDEEIISNIVDQCANLFTGGSSGYRFTILKNKIAELYPEQLKIKKQNIEEEAEKKRRQEEINKEIEAAQPEIEQNKEQLTALCSILFPEREVDDRMLTCVCKRIDKIKDVDAFIDYHKKNPSVSINCKGFEQTYNTIKSVSDEYVNPIDYYITYVQDMMRYEQSIGA